MSEKLSSYPQHQQIALNFLSSLIITKLNAKTPHESRMCPYGFQGQKVKGQCHNALMTYIMKLRAKILPIC